MIVGAQMLPRPNWLAPDALAYLDMPSILPPNSIAAVATDGRTGCERKR
jgi:hypothetical protein